MSVNLVQAWKQARQQLETAGVAGPGIDARLLVEAAAGGTRGGIVSDPHRAPAGEALWRTVLQGRPGGLPPRPDTETVFEYVLRDFPETAAWHVLDLGVGS